MTDIILYLIIASIGYVIGSRLLSAGTSSLRWTGPIQSSATCFILFVMGTRIGSNREVIEDLTSIGFQALIITLIIMASTIAFLFGARHLLGFDRYGVPHSASDGASKSQTKQSGQASETKFDSMTFLIVLFVAIGMAFGHFMINRIFSDYDLFANIASWLIKIGLCLLLFFVGLDLGLSGNAIQNFKKAGIKIFIFPLATVLGTIVGGLIVSLIFPLNTRESLSIACGFGWYSLAPAIILDAGHVSASAISFIHNVMRELLSIIAIPFIAKYIGYVEASGVSAAPSMDICLPVVERATNSTVAVYAFITGVVTSVLVPILVPLFV